MGQMTVGRSYLVVACVGAVKSGVDLRLDRVEGFQYGFGLVEIFPRAFIVS